MADLLPVSYTHLDVYKRQIQNYKQNRTHGVKKYTELNKFDLPGIYKLNCQNVTNSA